MEALFPNFWVMLLLLLFRWENLILLSSLGQCLSFGLLLWCNFNWLIRFLVGGGWHFLGLFLLFLSFFALFQGLFCLLDVLGVGVLSENLGIGCLNRWFIFLLFMLDNLFDSSGCLLLMGLLLLFDLHFNVLSWSVFSVWVGWESIWVLLISISSLTLDKWLLLDKRLLLFRSFVSTRREESIDVDNIL